MALCGLAVWNQGKDKASTESPDVVEGAIEGWESDSPAMKSIVEFVEASADEGSDGFIPQVDRVAVFDMDGTLFGERFPTYFNDWLYIQREIGRVPVLAFGNSTGDFSMATYTLSNQKYEGRAYMLLCDDVERDYGDPQKAAEFKAECEECGFATISEKDEFALLYPEGVAKTAVTKEEAVAQMRAEAGDDDLLAYVKEELDQAA